MQWPTYHWSALQGNKFRKRIHAKMAFFFDGLRDKVKGASVGIKGDPKTGVARSASLPKSEMMRIIHYDREYVLAIIAQTVIKPLVESNSGKLEYKTLERLFKDAYDYYCGQTEFFKGEPIESYAWRLARERMGGYKTPYYSFAEWRAKIPKSRWMSDEYKLEMLYQKALKELRECMG